jgi:HEAT repeat protein
MWDDLRRVDWNRLTHAYGPARETPQLLLAMISPDAAKRDGGWSGFWGMINHQGDFYDSTVAAIPFLIEALAHAETPGREQILYYLRDRWLDAPHYGGDPVVTEPPGGIDIPTPLLTDQAPAVSERASCEGSAPGDPDEFDPSTARRMDLCAWQTGRAIQAGCPKFERLLDDPNQEVAAAAGAILLLWRETRIQAKEALVRAIADEANPVEQARRILELAVYAANEDAAVLAEWVAPHRPACVRAAAALAWAWLCNPVPLPASAARALEETSAPGEEAFASLPRVGVYQRGTWVLPANAAALSLRLAESPNRELRWRAVQALTLGSETARQLSTAQVVPVLLNSLSDDYNRIRAAAAEALAQRGEVVLDIAPDAVPVLVQALEAHRSPEWEKHYGLDSDACVCGHAARLLAAVSHRLTIAQRRAALAGIDLAARRYVEREEAYVTFNAFGGSMSTPASRYLQEQFELVATPKRYGFSELFEVLAWPYKQDNRLSPAQCDRRLADALARAPEEVIAAAIAAVGGGIDRNAALGAVYWLATLGPAAGSALEALDHMAGRSLHTDVWALNHAVAASTFIRQSLLVTPEKGEWDEEEHISRREVTRWLRAAEAYSSDLHGDEILGPLARFLTHPDPYVRACAAEGLAILPETDPLAGVSPLLEQMLSDEAFADVGIAGEYLCAGRLYHWRRERRAPRAAAIRALRMPGRRTDGDRILKAMLGEATQARVVCANATVPQRFTIAQWFAAAQAAGGLSVAEPLIRASEQQCSRQDGRRTVTACALELAEVSRHLSGRLLPI